MKISSSKKPGVYVGASQKVLTEHGVVRLSALGAAMSSLVTVAEILKSKDMAVEKQVMISLEEFENEDDKGTTRRKPKLEVVLEKSANFEEALKKDEAERAERRRIRQAAAAEEQ